MRKLCSLFLSLMFILLLLTALTPASGAQVLRNAPPYTASVALQHGKQKVRSPRVRNASTSSSQSSIKTDALIGTDTIVADWGGFNDKERIDGATKPLLVVISNISEDTTVNFSGVTVTDGNGDANPDYTVTTTCTQLGPEQSCNLSISFSVAAACDETIAVIDLNDDDPEGGLEFEVDGLGADTATTVDDLTDPKLTPTALAQSLVGTGVTVSNVTYTGANRAAGNFSTASNIVGFTGGIVLSTGSVRNVIGPNCSSSIDGENGTAGDPDLTTLANIGNNTGVEVTTNDAAVLEFDFVPTSSSISFQYVFSSDEYNEYVYDFNDVFGFFLNGNNIALIPGTTTPVAINNVNQGNSTGTPNTPPANSQYFVNNDFQFPTTAPLDTEMDGLTVVFTAQATVTPNQTNHIKLAIADANDFALDSNVFIKAGSLSSTDLTLTPQSQAFGSVAVGSTSNPITFTLTNVGTESVDLNGITASTNFTETDNCDDGLNSGTGSGTSCTIQVVFAPQTAGPLTGTLTVNYTPVGGTTAQTVTSSLTGTGTGSGGTITVSPQTLGFGSQKINTTSTAQAVTVTNTGGAAVTVTNVAAPAGFTQTNNCTTIAVEGSCTINVSFAPTAVQAYSGNLTITDNASGSPQAVALTGTGTSGTGTITIAPASLSFTQVIGTTSPAQVVTITNTGTTSVTVSSVAAPTTFAQTNNCTTIAANATCAINVTFTPTSTETANGNLVINDTASGSPHTVALTGTGVNSPVVISIAPGGSDTATSVPGGTAYYGLIITAVPGFTGTVQLGCTTSSPTVTCTAVPSSITLTGTGSTEVAFAIQTYCKGATNNTGSVPTLPALPGGTGGGLALFFATLALAGAGWTFRQNPRTAVAFALILLVILGGAACSGGPAKGPNGITPAGTYFITLSATTSGGTVSLPNFLKLVVN
jgi:Abnormal spindle-like microcephaly-assoc'd, ASPM-SPD-2-Hydin